jgi:DNA-binding transcriptional ArsR family regulator
VDLPGFVKIEPQDALPLAIISREARESALLFKCLSDSTRLTIVGLLAAEGQLSVGQLCERLAISGPAITSHLRLLRVSGLVATYRNGSRVLYSLSLGFDDMVDQVRSAMAAIRKITPSIGIAKWTTG